MSTHTEEEVSTQTRRFVSNIIPNTSTNLKRKNVLKIAAHAYNNSNIGQTAFQTKVARIHSLKKIIFIIGLLKKELSIANTNHIRNNIENKLIRLTFKLDEIVNKYDLNYDNLKEYLFVNDNDYLTIIGDSHEKAFIGLTTATSISNGYMKKYEMVNLFELNINIKNSINLDVYHGVLFIKKAFEQYLELIDINNDKDLFINTIQSLIQLNKFIEYLTINDDFLKMYVNSNEQEQQRIRKIVRSNYIDDHFSISPSPDGTKEKV